MKHIKQYENFFTNLFKKSTRKADGIYYWTSDEQSALEDIGFINSSPGSSIGLFNYTPIINNKIDKIIIRKNAETIYDQEDYFYDVEIIANNKQLIKDFDNINDVINFVKPFIPDVEIDSKKYNL